MKVMKIFFSIIGLLILVCAFAIFSLIYFVDPNKLRPVIIEEVKNETGYILAIEGKMSWAFYPRMAVKIDHIKLSTPDKSQPFVDAHDVYIATDLIELLRSKEILQGEITISNLTLMNIQAQNVSANSRWKDNVLTLNPIKASLYGGTLEAVANGTDFYSIPKWKWDVKFNGIQMKPLLQDVKGADSKIKISGTGFLSLQVETKGKSREQLLSQLNGSSDFRIQNGVVEGIDINYYLQTANALLDRESETESTVKPVNSDQTEFNQLTGAAFIKNGVAETNNILMLAQFFSAKAQGNIELLSNNIDLKLQIKPQLEKSKIHWEIPMLLSGNLRHPEIRLDMVEIQKMLAGIEIDNLKEKAVEQIKKHVHGKAGEFLQNLLGGGDNDKDN